MLAETPHAVIHPIEGYETIDRGLQTLGVGALIVLEDQQYLMQLRDDRADIWFPDYWGCFGGAVETGESFLTGLHRELVEELEFDFDLRQSKYFTRFYFDLHDFGLGHHFRTFYLVSMNREQQEKVVLHEGREARALPAKAILNELRVTPYDAMAIYLHQRLLQR